MTLQHFDFRLVPCGRDALLRPLTRAGENWLSDHLPPGERRLGAYALLPQERIADTLTRIMLAGLTIAPLSEQE
jgi:hypothetical protein